MVSRGEREEYPVRLSFARPSLVLTSLLSYNTPPPSTQPFKRCVGCVNRNDSAYAPTDTFSMLSCRTSQVFSVVCPVSWQQEDSTSTRWSCVALKFATSVGCASVSEDKTLSSSKREDSLKIWWAGSAYIRDTRLQRCLGTCMGCARLHQH